MRLTVLDYGSLALTLDTLVPGDGDGRWVEVGIPGYLIQTDDGRAYLVDTGLPNAYYVDPVAAARDDGYGRWLRRATATALNRPTAQLAALGLTPTAITHLVVTHTHFDHAGGMADFPGATFVVQHDERILPRPVYPRFSWPAGVVEQVVAGDSDLAPGIRFLHTPGHTPGHGSVLIELPQTGPLILAIDALYLPMVLERDNFAASWHEDLARASGHRLARLAAETGAWLIYGHDPEQWASLRKAPDYYE